MKNLFKLIGIIAIVAVMGLGFTACGGDDGGGGGYVFDPSLGAENIGKPGPAGGIIFYYSASGFSVTGPGSFIANYLEVSLNNQGTLLTWASTDFSSTNILGTGTAIGTGKENTRLILAKDANAPAAKVTQGTIEGSKSDWFLPSKDELDEMYKAKSHFGGISSGFFWSSSQYSNTDAWRKNFANGDWGAGYKSATSSGGLNTNNVRAIRAFSSFPLPPPLPGYAAIGDTGPGGGIVFYDKGSVSDGWRYLEAATTNQATTINWCTCTFGTCDVTTGTTIGTGKANTDAIIAAHSGDTASNNAAKVVETFRNDTTKNGGKNDWFLPSKDELNEMYYVSSLLGSSFLGITSGRSFWSSSQWTSNVGAWGQDLNDGSQVGYNKSGSVAIGRVRVIRAF